MKNVRILAVLCAATLVLTACWSPAKTAAVPTTAATAVPTAVSTAIPTAPGTRFSSVEGGFLVTSPATFTETIATVEVDAGSLEVHTFQGDSDGVSYSIVYADYPNQYMAIDTESFLRAIRDAQIASMKGTLIAEGKATLAGATGREIQVAATTDEGQKVVYRTRIYWAPTRLYQVSVLTPEGRNDESIVVSFLDSFELTGRAN